MERSTEAKEIPVEEEVSAATMMKKKGIARQRTMRGGIRRGQTRAVLGVLLVKLEGRARVTRSIGVSAERMKDVLDPALDRRIGGAGPKKSMKEIASMSEENARDPEKDVKTVLGYHNMLPAESSITMTARTMRSHQTRMKSIRLLSVPSQRTSLQVLVRTILLLLRQRSTVGKQVMQVGTQTC
jgi:hypothetical protein